jgi:mannose-6-phosphate isomerase-like protein (cupin superfamily)
MERLWFIADLVEVLEAGEAFALARMYAPAGNGTPLHVHEHEDEGFYVLDGSLTVWIGDAEPVTLGPGEFALAPRGVPHTNRVGDAPATYLVTSTPGGFVSFVREAGVPAARAELPVLDGPPDTERLSRIASAHGITILGPPGMLPAELTAASS